MSATENLPKTHPSWCDRTHEQSFEEGCPIEVAAVHRGPQFEARHQSAGEGYAWIRTELTAEPAGYWWMDATIRFEVEVNAGTREDQSRASDLAPQTDAHVCMFPLSSGAARILARRLLHLADLADLEQ